MRPGMELIDVLDRLRENGKRRQPEEVELHEAYVFDVLLVELAHRVFGRAVGVVERTEVGELAGSNEYAPGVHAEISGEAFKGLREPQDFLVFVVALDRFAEFRHVAQRVVERDVFARLLRNQLRERVRLHVGDVERATDVAHGRLRAHRAEGRDLTHGVDPVRSLHVLDRAVAVVLAEVDVEVRHRNAFRVEEAFEKEVEFERIEVRDAERIRNERARARASARTHGNAVSLRPVDEVLNDEEVPRELHPLDDVEFVREALVVGGTLFVLQDLVGIEEVEALLETLARKLLDVVVERHAVGGRKERQLRLRKDAVQVAALCDFHGISKRARHVREEFAHLFFRLEVLFGRIVFRASGILKREALRNGAAHFVCFEVRLLNELHRVRRHDGKSVLGRKVRKTRRGEFVVGTPRTLHFDVEAVAEDRLQFFNRLVCKVEALVDEVAPEFALGAARKSNKPVRTALRKPRGIDLPAELVVLREKSLRQKNAKRVIARVVHAQNAEACRRVGLFEVFDAQVAPEDGLQARGERMRVKTKPAENIHQVRDAHGHAAHFEHLVNHRVDANQPVRDGVLGMKAQVDELGIGHVGLAEVRNCDEEERSAARTGDLAKHPPPQGRFG